MSEPEYERVILSNIRGLINRAGMKQKVVAQRAGLTEGQLSDLLQSRKILRAELVPRIAAALGVTVEEIYAIGEAGEESSP